MVRELVVAEHGNSGGVAATRRSVTVEFGIAEFVGSIVELIASEREGGTSLDTGKKVRETRIALRRGRAVREERGEEGGRGGKRGEEGGNGKEQDVDKEKEKEGEGRGGRKRG